MKVILIYSRYYRVVGEGSLVDSLINSNGIFNFHDPILTKVKKPNKRKPNTIPLLLQKIMTRFLRQISIHISVWFCPKWSISYLLNPNYLIMDVFLNKLVNHFQLIPKWDCCHFTQVLRQWVMIVFINKGKHSFQVLCHSLYGLANSNF